MKRALLISSVLLLTVAVAGPAMACALAPQNKLQVSDADPPEDVPPPEAPVLALEFLHRGEAEGEQASDSCDDTGFFRFRIEPDRPELGYRFNVRSGTLPDGYAFPEDPVHSNLGGPFWTDWWTDGATDAQEAFRFELEVVAVDKWGRTSEPSNTLVVEDPGREAAGDGARGGCTSSPGEPSPKGFVTVLMLGAAALLSWRRRRGRER